MQPLIAKSTDLFLTDTSLREGPSCSVTWKMEAFKATGNVNGLPQQRPLKFVHPAEETLNARGRRMSVFQNHGNQCPKSESG